MKYLAATDPHEGVAEPLDIEEPVGRVDSSRRPNRAVGIAVAAGVAIVGLGWGGRAWAPAAETDRGADSAAELAPSLRASGADVAVSTAGPAGGDTEGDLPTRSTSRASTDTTLVAPWLSVTWSVGRSAHATLVSVTGDVYPGIERVVVGIEHDGHALASATVPAGLEDERTGTDGRPRGRSRFAASLVVRGRLPANGLRLVVRWSDDGSTGSGTIGWPVRVAPADGEHVGLRTAIGRHRR